MGIVSQDRKQKHKRGAGRAVAASEPTEIALRQPQLTLQASLARVSPQPPDCRARELAQLLARDGRQFARVETRHHLVAAQGTALRQHRGERQSTEDLVGNRPAAATPLYQPCTARRAQHQRSLAPAQKNTTEPATAKPAS